MSPGPRPGNAEEGLLCVGSAALVQTLALACPCLCSSLGSSAHNKLLEVWVPHSLASHLRSTPSLQSSGRAVVRGVVFGPGTIFG